MEYIPQTLDECILYLSHLEDVVREFKTAEDVSAYHHSLGRMIRNQWGLWKEDSPLHQHFESLGLFHPDDMSGLIMESFRRHLHGIPLDVPGQVQRYQIWWDTHDY